MSIKLVAIDLDGTLLNSDHQVSEENKEAIRKAKAQDVKIVLVTGRPLKAMLHILEDCGLTEAGDIALTYNGGLVQWTQTGESIREITFPKEDALDIYQLSQELGLPCNFIDLDVVHAPPYPEGKPSMYPEVMHALPFEPIDMNDLPEDFTVNKIVYCWRQEELDQKITEIPDIYRERYNLIKSRPTLLEFMPKSIDKGKGLDLLSEILDIEVADMMAIGDQENDLAMVQRAGTGVAMENAIDLVKEAAQIVTKSNVEHGVAYAIEKYVLN